MIINKKDTIDVLIVGAGPAGLMMACQLANLGVPFRIIDKKKRQTGYSGAMFIQARTLEVFEQLGLAASFLEKGQIVEKITLFYNGKRWVQVPMKRLGDGLSQFPFILMLKQDFTEKLMIRYLQNYDIEIERDTELVRFHQEKDIIHAKLLKANQDHATIRCKYLVGADGIHSTVRQVLQIGWDGHVNNIPLFVTDCEVQPGTFKKRSDKWKYTFDKAGSEVVFTISRKSIAGIFPLNEKLWRVDSVISGSSGDFKNVSFSEVSEGFAGKTNLPVHLKNLVWFSVFKSNTYLAGVFGLNRCFLIGDAAHAHTPIGAQGMNTGMQDAYNLAWKLHFVVNNKLSPQILETYDQERRPIAIDLIRSTDVYFELAIHNDWKTRFFRVHLFPVLLKLFKPLLSWSVLQKAFFWKVSEIGISYKKSLLLMYGGKAPCKYLKPGKRLPFVTWEYANGKVKNLHQLISPDRFVVLCLLKGSANEAELDLIEKEYNNLLKICKIHCNEFTRELFRNLKIRGNVYCLVRPDGYLSMVSRSMNLRLMKGFFRIFENEREAGN